MKSKTMEQRRNNRFTTTEKIFMYTFSIITILAIICFIVGALSIDSPDTAIPEIMLISSVIYFAIVIAIGSK